MFTQILWKKRNKEAKMNWWVYPRIRMKLQIQISFQIIPNIPFGSKVVCHHHHHHDYLDYHDINADLTESPIYTSPCAPVPPHSSSSQLTPVAGFRPLKQVWYHWLDISGLHKFLQISDCRSSSKFDFLMIVICLCLHVDVSNVCIIIKSKSI